MCNKYKSHHLKEGRSITGCVKTARGAASEDLQHRAKIIMTSEVPEGDLSWSQPKHTTCAQAKPVPVG